MNERIEKEEKSIKLGQKLIAFNSILTLTNETLDFGSYFYLEAIVILSVK